MVHLVLSVFNSVAFCLLSVVITLFLFLNIVFVIIVQLEQTSVVKCFLNKVAIYYINRYLCVT